MHLNNDGTYILVSNLFDFFTYFIFSKSIWLTKADSITVSKENCKQSFDSSDEVKHNNSSDYTNIIISYEKVIEKDSKFLGKLRVKNVNRIIIGNLNINSISSNFDQLELFVQGKVDTLIVAQTELDSTSLTSQLMIYGYSEPYSSNRNRNWAGILIYVREDITSKVLVDR